MRSTKTTKLLLGACALALGIGLAWALAAAADEAAGWALNATAIESCSCPMFCTCYFSDHPAGHGGHHGEEHFCRFNMAYKVNHGHHGGTDLAGAKFWIAGDLGAEFGDGEADWAVVTFDPAVTQEQRAGIAAALPAVFPIRWKSFAIGEDAAIEWQATAERAVGRLDGGPLLLAQQPPVARQDIRHHRGVDVPDVGQIVDVVDRGGEVEGSHGVRLASSWRRARVYSTIRAAARRAETAIVAKARRTGRARASTSAPARGGRSRSGCRRRRTPPRCGRRPGIGRAPASG